MLYSSTVAPGRILPAGQTSSSMNSNMNMSSSGMSQVQGRMNPLSEVTSPFSYKGGSGSSCEIPRIKPPNPVSQPPSYRPPALPPLPDIFEISNSNISSSISISNSIKLSYDDSNKSGKGSSSSNNNNNNIGKSFSYDGVRRDVGAT
jgi:hypothetical protein